MPFVCSTATSDVKYTVYQKVSKDLNKPIRHILIKGGSNVANKNLVTPLGVVTKVTDEELEILETIQSFRRARDAGFLTVTATKKDPGKLIGSMETRDESSPLVPGDFTAKKGAGKAPIVAGQIEMEDDGEDEQGL